MKSHPMRLIFSFGALGALAALTASVNFAQSQAAAAEDSPDQAKSQIESAPYYQGGGRGGAPVGMYKAQVNATWFDNSKKFWYRNDLRNNDKEFILVDAAAGKRAPAFDHEKLAAALSKASSATANAKKLPFSDIAFVDSNKAVVFDAYGKTWKCDLSTYAVTAGTSPTQVGIRIPAPNHVDNAVDIARIESVWGGGNIPSWDPLARSEKEMLVSPYWEGDVAPQADAGADDELLAPQAGQGRGRRGGRGGAARGAQAGARGDQSTQGQRGGGRGGFGGSATEENPLASPDNAFSAYVKDNNVYVKAADGKVTQLSTDGDTSQTYGRLVWSPDSKGLIGWRIEQGDYNPVFVIRSSPPDPTGRRPDLSYGPATMQERDYVQAGNKGTMVELSVFDMANLKQVKPALERIDTSYGTPNLRWNKDNQHFTFSFEDRGHTRFRILEVDSHNGAMRSILDDKADDAHKFLWINQGASATNFPSVTYLDDTDEIIYATEKDGWRHAWLVNAKTGNMTLMTKGDFPLRGLEYIDTQARVMWFSALGVYKDQDPYLRHVGRVNFDGSNLVWLTEGNGDHTVAYSPDYKYIVDSYNRVDLPPITELRSTTDGKLVCKLEEADISQLKEENTYHPSEVFVAKGRDGKTDIWGIITRPVDFDPNKKYPVIENIYAGPHGFFVPKTFTPAARNANLTSLGFIIVQIDGMGTFGRSKAFHDVAWKNVADAGFPDRILWMKAAAAKYPYMDLTRVGIYGTSAGGQSSTGALLFHPEFYKVAVSNSGCHDNRIDKQDWNEHWMGYRPDVWSDSPDNWYATNSNVDNAWRLQGHLYLVVPEDDHNVPPESTFRVVNALLASQKDFALMVVPRADHGAASPTTQRKLQDYFVKYLLDKDPPNRNIETSKEPPTSRGGGAGRGAARGNRGGGGRGNNVGPTRGTGSAAGTRG